MKHLLNSGTKALATLLIIFVIGMFLPLLFTTVLVILSDISYQEVLVNLDNSTALFWIACVIGWICGMFYMGDEIDKNKGKSVR